MTAETFIFGVDKVPGWFDIEGSKGRVKCIYDDNNKLIRAQIKTGVSSYTAEIGDSIVKSESGLVVIKQDKAIKYNVQKKNNKQTKRIIKEDEVL